MKVRALGFHHVDDTLADYTSVQTSLFFDVIKQLAAESVFVVPSSKNQSKRDLYITFDDAYKSIYEPCIAANRKWGFTATIFVVTDYINKPNLWNVKAKYLRHHMSLTELHHLQSLGFEIGNHTASHQYLPKLSESLLHEEIMESAEKIKYEFGRSKAFAYPFGAWSERIVDIVSREHDIAFSTFNKSRNVDSATSKFNLRRFMVCGHHTPADVNAYLHGLDENL